MTMNAGTETMPLLAIGGLRASAGGRTILNGLDLVVMPGEVHAVMGPNGAGKSTLGHLLAGRPGIAIEAGEVRYDGEDLLALAPEERAARGLFLAFQYPVEIPGVNNSYFIRGALNAQHRARGEEEIDAVAFMRRLRQAADELGMDAALLQRNVNEGFSGGEKKRNEVLQLHLLEPRLAILDETDSGLDIDALRTVARGVNGLRNGCRAFIVITHYQRLLDDIVPDRVHVMAGGRIAASGGLELVRRIEEEGYAWLPAAEQGEAVAG